MLLYALKSSLICKAVKRFSQDDQSLAGSHFNGRILVLRAHQCSDMNRDFLSYVSLTKVVSFQLDSAGLQPQCREKLEGFQGQRST